MEKNGVELCMRLLDEYSINHPVVDSVHSVHGLTPLMAACKFVRLSTARALIERGANPNVARKIMGDTALHLAAMAGSALLVKILLDAGAVQMRDRKGCTPLDYAKERPENHSLISMLWSVPDRPGKVCLVVNETVSRSEYDGEASLSQQMKMLLEERDDESEEGQEISGGSEAKEEGRETLVDNFEIEEDDLEEYTIDISSLSDDRSSDFEVKDADLDKIDPRVSLKLQWTASANNGTVIRNNEICWAPLKEVDKVDNQTDEKVISSSSRLQDDPHREATIYSRGNLPGSRALAVLKGLAPCTWYKFKVRSRNVIGWGAFSSPNIIWSGSSVPEGMKSPVVVRQTSSVLMLEWQPPESCNGEIVDRYEIEVNFRSLRTSETGAATHSNSFRRVTPLLRYEIPVERTDVHTSNLWYVFRVRAHNLCGWSSFSPPSAGCETLDFSEAKALGARQVLVNWPRVLGASKYQVQAACAESLQDLFVSPTLPWKTMCEVLPDPEQDRRPNTIVSGCTPAYYYVFRVLDHHEMFGWSFGAKSEPIQMKADVPARPRPPVLQNVTPQALIVTNDLSEDNGRRIDGMEISVKLLDKVVDKVNGARKEKDSEKQHQKQPDRPWYSLDLIKVGPSHHSDQGKRSLKTKVPDLEIFRSYVLRCRLRNSVGWSDWSSDSDPMTTSPSPPDPPSRPEIVCVGDKSVLVSWDAPKSFGSDLVGFRAQMCHLGPELLPHQRNRAERSSNSDEPRVDARTLVNSLFLTIDGDNDGFLSKNELLQAFSRDGTNQKARRLLSDILSCDHTSGSLVDDVSIQSLGLLLRLNEEYQDAFSEIDTDRSGYVTRDELLLFCAEKEGWSDIQLPHHPHPYPETSFEQQNLCPGEAYRFRIVAVNQVGPGGPSSSTKVVMPCIAALAPPMPVVVSTTQTTVSLEFFATSDNGGDPSISIYEIARRLGCIDDRSSGGGGGGGGEEEQRNNSGTEARATPTRRASINRLLEWTVVGSVQLGPTDSMPYKFTDKMLVPGSCYDYAVRAVSIVGPSPWSEASGPVTTDGKEPSVPSAPVLQEGGRHGTTLNIEWLPPAAALSKKNVELEYEIEQQYLELEDVETNQASLLQWHRSRFMCNFDGDDGEHPWAHISNLLPGACVRFRVRAKNSYGVGAWGAESMGIYSAVTVPDPVDPPTIECRWEREIKVRWTRPPCRGAPVTMYELARLTVGKNWDTIGEWEVELRTASMHYVVPNLKPASSLCFRVRAYNKLGWGEFGYACDNTRTLSTIPATPSPPIMLSWKPDDLTILVSWSHVPSAIDNGLDNGAEIIRYEVQRRDFTEGACWEDVGTTSGADRFIETIEPKPVCLKRWFRVRAVNAHGNSSWSEKSVDFICRLGKP